MNLPPPTIGFVCQAGRLSAQAVLLASSLRHQLGARPHLIATVPTPAEQWGRLTSATKQALAALDVELQPGTNPIGNHYPIGNKLSILPNLPADSRHGVLLDTDQLCMTRPAQWMAVTAEFAAAPADFVTWGAPDGLWRRAYAMFNLPAPPQSMLSGVSGEWMAPYFNAGFLTTRQPHALADCWISTARTLEAAELPNRYPWLDQIALPIALARLGLGWRTAPPAWNWPGHVRPLTGRLPYFLHYHWPKVLRAEPHARAVISAVLAAAPKQVTSILAEDPDWQPLIPRRRRWFGGSMSSTAAVGLDVVVTGLPRSGTSLICRLLHDLPDTVAINEPGEIFAALRQPMPWKLAAWYRDTRRAILEGEQIENKLLHGRVIEDTARHDERSRYSPEVAGPGFTLASKNTLAYLARLDAIASVLPEARIIACVRHPLDTIASWKRTFEHLRTAAPHAFPVGGPGDLSLNGHQATFIDHIAAAESEAERRAMLWSYLARLILARKPLLSLLRYENLTQAPRKTIAAIVPGANRSRNWPVLQARTEGRKHLDQADLDAIHRWCSAPAWELGYDL